MSKSQLNIRKIERRYLPRPPGGVLRPGDLVMSDGPVAVPATNLFRQSRDRRPVPPRAPLSHHRLSGGRGLPHPSHLGSSQGLPAARGRGEARGCRAGPFLLLETLRAWAGMKDKSDMRSDTTLSLIPSFSSSSATRLSFAYLVDPRPEPRHFRLRGSWYVSAVRQVVNEHSCCISLTFTQKRT